MAELSPWPEADALLDQALDLDDAARRGWLATLATRDAHLAFVLAKVLRELRPDGFLAPGAPLGGAVAADIEAATDREGAASSSRTWTPLVKLAG
jgi:hypothetical protein